MKTSLAKKVKYLNSMQFLIDCLRKNNLPIEIIEHICKIGKIKFCAQCKIFSYVRDTFEVPQIFTKSGLWTWVPVTAWNEKTKVCFVCEVKNCWAHNLSKKKELNARKAAWDVKRSGFKPYQEWKNNINLRSGYPGDFMEP